MKQVKAGLFALVAAGAVWLALTVLKRDAAWTGVGK
jgi:hypothetical protein